MYNKSVIGLGIPHSDISIVSGMPKRLMIRKLVIAIAALIIGGLIYVLWRSDSLIMFKWFDRFGLYDFIKFLRGFMARYSESLPCWLCFSLPNALWLFSGLLFFDYIWDKNALFYRAFWMSLFWMIAIGAEIGQYLHVVPGTFDWHDMILMGIATVAWASFVRYGERSKNSLHKNRGR